jgi:SAM-dependent methyltransferase
MTSPATAKADLSRFVHERINEHLKANVVVNSLYTPPSSDAVVPLANPGKYTHQRIWRMKRGNLRSTEQPLPVPPAELLYYEYNTEAYLASGEQDASVLRQFFERVGIRLTGISVLDLGCRDCRVLRHFAEDARACEFWGVDQHAPSMEWAKESLSPPFRFVTSSAYPHLPFEDRTFDVIFAISVLTHIASLSDAWLMELRRILKPGGHGLFTVHDEHSWRYLREDDFLRGLFGMDHSDIATGETGDLVIVDGPNLPSEYVNVFHSTARIKHEWGQYFDIVSIDPRAFSLQSMVVVRKPLSRAP